MAIDYTKRPRATPPAEPVAAQAAPPAAPPAAQSAPAVVGGKVQLTKGAPRVSLTKSGGAGGIARVNLNWSAQTPAAPPATHGIFSRMKAAAAVSVSKGVDLDLGCLYELADGRKGVIQALGNSFGSLNAAPWIQLDGDDRTGSVAGGENMSINFSQPGRFKRVLIFAMIYEGAPNWAAVDGVVTLTPANGQPVQVRLDATEASVRMCAVAQFVDNGGDLVFQREVQYIEGGQMALDKAYGWGMNWARGRK